MYTVCQIIFGVIFQTALMDGAERLLRGHQSWEELFTQFNLRSFELIVQ